MSAAAAAAMPSGGGVTSTVAVRCAESHLSDVLSAVFSGGGSARVEWVRKDHGTVSVLIRDADLAGLQDSLRELAGVSLSALRRINALEQFCAGDCGALPALYCDDDFAIVYWSFEMEGDLSAHALRVLLGGAHGSSGPWALAGEVVLVAAVPNALAFMGTRAAHTRACQAWLRGWWWDAPVGALRCVKWEEHPSADALAVRAPASSVRDVPRDVRRMSAALIDGLDACTPLHATALALEEGVISSLAAEGIVRILLAHGSSAATCDADGVSARARLAALDRGTVAAWQRMMDILSV